MNALLLGLALAVLPAAAPLAQDASGEAHPHVLMRTTVGALLLELDAEKAPETVANFLQYVDDGHYDGTIFHRVLTDFMAQGGGFDRELNQKPTRAPIKNEAENGLKNLYGTIAMARTGEVDSATSQFFLNAKDNAFLDHSGPGSAFGYCVFGKLVGGLDTFETLRHVPVVKNARVGGEVAYPVTQVVIEHAERVAPDQVGAVKLRLKNEAEAAAAAKRAATLAKLGDGIAFVKSQGAEVSDGVLTQSGLWTYDAVVGDGPSPRVQDEAELHYTGWLSDGTRFASSHDDGVPLLYPLTAFIEGWKQGITSMHAGGTRWLVIPPDLAYGSVGQEPNIPGDATLVFKVELLSVPRYADLAKALDFLRTQDVDPSAGHFTPSGLWVLDQVVGEGPKPMPSDKVTVHYTGWLPDGKQFDSSRARNEPTSFGLRNVIAGWTEGVGDMQKGGKRWLVIPYDLAYGVQGRPPVIPPKATLVFEVELLDF